MSRLLFLFLLFSVSTWAQHSILIDSLIRNLKTIHDDKEKIKALTLVANELSRTNPKKSIPFSKSALQLAKKINWQNGIADAYYSIGHAQYLQGSFPAALESWTNELKLREKTDNKEALSSALGNVGVLYDSQGDFSKAMEYYLRALNLAEEIGDKRRIASHLCNVARIYKKQDEPDKAVQYHLRAIKVADEAGDETAKAVNLGSIAGIHWKKGNLEQAQEYYLKAIIIDEKLGNKRNLAAWTANIAGIFSSEADTALALGNIGLMKEKYQEALKHTKNALRIAEELGDQNSQAYMLGNIGSIYFSIKQYDEAKDYIGKSSELAKKINARVVLMDNEQRLFEIYKERDDHALALQHYERYVKLKDSIYNRENKNIISELQIKYEAEKKENENKTLLKQNEIQALTISNNRYFTAALIGLLLTVVAAAYFINRHIKLKAQQVSMQLNQKLLRAQMNPHFIFNSLASIESFIYENEPKEAALYLAHFSRLMRLILENSGTDYITLEKEIETLEYYFSLQKLRLNEKMNYTIQTDHAIVKEQIYVPPMLTQPFIENAIEHGFRGLKQPGSVEVLFRLEGKNLIVEINDNGIGISQAQEQKVLHKLHTSMAIKITKERLEYLNRSKKDKLIFRVTDIVNKGKEISGTKVTFSIPLKNITEK